MKTLNQINQTLSLFESKYGIKVSEAGQGSAAWFKTKLGVLSASNASKIVAKAGSENRNTYMMELIAQICTGEQEEISSKFTDWGNQHEAAARSSYEFETGTDITQLPFVFKDESFREGCSPDGITLDKAIEIKSPFSATNYVKFLISDFLKPEWSYQVQFQMRVMDCAIVDMCQYHPNMKKIPLAIKTIERDEKIQSTFNDSIPQFIYDMDKYLNKIGVSFGSQWKS